MSWKPHWCESAQQIAAAHGWRLGENKDGVLVFEIEGGTQIPVDFDPANAHAALADDAAKTAINAAVAKALAAQMPDAGCSSC